MYTLNSVAECLPLPGCTALYSLNVGGYRGGGTQGGYRGEGGQGTFHPPCHIQHYHMVLALKGLRTMRRQGCCTGVVQMSFFTLQKKRVSSVLERCFAEVGSEHRVRFSFLGNRDGISNCLMVDAKFAPVSENHRCL